MESKRKSLVDLSDDHCTRFPLFEHFWLCASSNCICAGHFRHLIYYRWNVHLQLYAFSIKRSLVVYNVVQHCLLSQIFMLCLVFTFDYRCHSVLKDSTLRRAIFYSWRFPAFVAWQTTLKFFECDYFVCLHWIRAVFQYGQKGFPSLSLNFPAILQTREEETIYCYTKKYQATE